MSNERQLPGGKKHATKKAAIKEESEQSSWTRAGWKYDCTNINTDENSAMKNTPPPIFKRSFTTAEAAAILRVKPQTIRAGLCRDSHYMGLRPVKLSNRRLLWPADAVENLTIAGEV
jgi:hypothetical protein